MQNLTFFLSKVSAWLLGALVIMAISSVILFLVNQQTRYILYTFGISLSILLILVSIKYDNYIIKFKSPTSFSSVVLFDYLFILCSIVVFISNVIVNTFNDIIFVPSLILSFFLPGWVLCRIINHTSSTINLAVISFCVSIGLSSIFYIFGILAHIGSSALLLSSIYLCISFLPLIKQYLNGTKKKFQTNATHNSHEVNLVEVLTLAWIVIFFVFVISSLYPQLAERPGLDIVRHFYNSKQLSLAPETYDSQYPWFHFLWAGLNDISKPPEWLFYTGVAYLSIFIIFAFYIMAKSHLKDIDRRAPIIATIFFSVFCGFGWIYFVDAAVGDVNTTQHYDRLLTSYYASYWDIGMGEGAWTWLWFRPLTIGMTIFFALIYVIRDDAIKKKQYLIISSLLVLTLSQVHIPELIIYVVFIAILSLFSPTMRLRFKETALSIIIGVGASLMTDIVHQKLIGLENVSIAYVNYLPILVLAVIIFVAIKYQRRPKIHIRISHHTLSLILLFLYLVLLFHWFSTAEPSLLRELTIIYAVPWQYYPMLLGIVGIFAVPGSILIAKKYSNHTVVMFVVLLILALFLGRIVTFVNASFFDTGYWERRIFLFVFGAASILAAIVVLKLIDRIRIKHNLMSRFKALENIPQIAFLTTLVVVGTLSMFLSVDLQLLLLEKQGLSINESYIVDYLNNGTNQYSSLLTVSQRSMHIAEFSNLGYIVGYYKNQIWPSISPELPLAILSALDASPFLYISEEDKREITTKGYENGYVSSHLLSKAPNVLELSDSRLLRMPEITPPLQISDTILILPDEIYEDNNQNNYYAYDMLSLGRYNYTTAVLSDLNSIGKARIIIAANEDVASEVLRYRNQHNLKFDHLIVLNTNNPYNDFFVDPSNQSMPGFSVASMLDLDDWKTNGYASGNISVPSITNKPDNEGSLNSTLAFKVGSGRYGFWEISKSLEQPINLSKFDFMKFKWFGRGDGKWYVVDFSSGPYVAMSYKFQDTWHGWKDIVLQLQVPPGRNTLLGVTYEKQATGQTELSSNVNKLAIKTASSTHNQGGDFYIQKFMFGNASQSSGIQGISGKNKTQIHFPEPIDVYPFVPKTNYNATFFYDSGVPFILHTRYNDYNISYINVNPIVESLNSVHASSQHLYPLLGNMLSLTESNLSSYNPISVTAKDLVSGGVAGFSNARFDGDLVINASSAIINVGSNSDAVMTLDGMKSTIKNMSHIVPVSTENIVIKSKEGILNGGSGFYVHSLLKKPLLQFSGPDTSIISLHFDNGTTRTVVGKNIKMSLEESSMLVRNPRVMSSGTISFGNFYAYGELYDKMRTLGEDVNVQGRVLFSPLYSDKSTIVNNTMIEGKVLTPSIYSYDELANLAKIISFPHMRFILTLLVVFVIYLLYFSPSKNAVISNTRKPGPQDQIQ